ncbi:MAG: Uma2 family endonuclease [Gemmatimonadetes bacterium]|nr:MAG: Uma2 family endonuclease [Gemmatimonadota bacterium]PYP02277.1 MAG: Uma2 family endonuclease [Gemmatimonadota bacterium]
MPAEPTYVPRMSPPALLTADELQHVYVPDKRVELVRGLLVVRELPGMRHARVAMDLALALGAHVRAAALGRVYAEAGFKLASNPDTVRGPDVAFIRRDRIPDPEPTGFAHFAPDLVVEVISPGDRAGEVLAKVADWLSAGTRLVWVLDPARRVARVYRDDGTEQILTADESLDGGDVVPGFSCPVGEIF